jgi:hypothetical protein
MNKLLLLFVCLHIYRPVLAQSYQPFPAANAFWLEETESNIIEDPGWCAKIQHTITGDTLIGILVYHKLELSRINYFYPYPGMCVYDSIVAIYPVSYEGAFREDSSLKKIYFIPFDSANEKLIYNFNVSVGDTMLHHDDACNDFHVTSIDSVLAGGSYRKRYNCMECGFPVAGSSIIEGIGSTAGLFGSWCENFEGEHALLCLSVNSSGIYPDGSSCTPLLNVSNTNGLSSAVRIFPNPTHGIIHAEFINSNLKTVSLYDAFASLIFEKTTYDKKTDIDLSTFPKGMFFLKVNDGNTIQTQRFILL